MFQTKWKKEWASSHTPRTNITWNAYLHIMFFITTKFHEILLGGFRRVALTRKKQDWRTGKKHYTLRKSLRGVFEGWQFPMLPSCAVDIYYIILDVNWIDIYIVYITFANICVCISYSVYDASQNLWWTSRIDNFGISPIVKQYHPWPYTCSITCLFVCLVSIVPLQNFSLMETPPLPVKGCNFDLCSALLTIEQ